MPDKANDEGKTHWHARLCPSPLTCHAEFRLRLDALEKIVATLATKMGVPLHPDGPDKPGNSDPVPTNAELAETIEIEIADVRNEAETATLRVDTAIQAMNENTANIINYVNIALNAMRAEENTARLDLEERMTGLQITASDVDWNLDDE